MGSEDNDTIEPGVDRSDADLRSADGRAAREPSWRRAAAGSVATAAILVAFLSLVSKVPINESLPFAGLVLVFGVPIDYYTDRYRYRRRLAKGAAARKAKR